MKRPRSQIITISIAFAAFVALMGSHGVGVPAHLVAALPLRQESSPATCRQLDRSYIEFNVITSNENAAESGRVLSANDGTLAVLVISSDVDDEGGLIAIDYATSVRVNAIILHSGQVVDARSFDPPVRSGADVRLEDQSNIDSVSFCYQVSIPSPPKATTAEPNGEATQDPTIAPTATQLTLDLSGVKTAEAGIVEIAATATAAASLAADELSTAQAGAAVIAATATAAAESAVKSDSELVATIAAQDEMIASAEAAANDARATADALQATLSAPTQSPTETPVPEPTATPAAPEIVTTLVYETTGKTPFADWQPVDGWDLGGEVARTDGSGNRTWLVVPVPSGLAVDAIVDIEFRVIGGEICPRNFGFGIRGSATGFYAAGIEWACDPGLVLWSGGTVIGSAEPDQFPDPGDTWHSMRISAIGDQISVSVDGEQYLTQTNTDFPSGNLVAFWTDAVGLEVRRVQVWEVTT